MNRAVFYAVAACVLWGTAFLAPIVLKGWSPWAVAGGRYVAYGLLSVLSLIASRTLFTLPSRWWRDALWLSLIGNAVYYVLLSASLQLAGPFAPSVIIGTLPITLALAGRALDKQHHHNAVALGMPLSLIAAGLICVNWAEYHASSENNTSQSSQYWLGIACAVLAHIAWLLFGLWNARYLKTHTTITSSQWSNLLGASLLPAAVGMMLLGFYQAQQLPQLPTSWTVFIVAVFITGLCSGWAATLLWSKASRVLPVSLAAQLIVVETISAIVMSALYLQKLPAPLTMVGTVLLVLGVLAALRRFNS